MSSTELKKTAIIYDFDGTLARGNLQECSFIPQVNMTRDQFWGAVKQMTQDEDADEILVEMLLCSMASKALLGLRGSTSSQKNTVCFCSTT
jgi:hypothetical protein